jgi:hypothetical protein
MCGSVFSCYVPFHIHLAYCLDHIFGLPPSHPLNYSNLCPSFLSLLLFTFLLFHFPFNSFSAILVHLVIWWQFMLLVVQTSSSWSTIQRRPLSLNSVCAICLLFSQVLYIYPRMSRITQITWFQICYTRFLWPFKGANGWLVMVIIALLVIVWFTTLKTPFWSQVLQVILSRLWRRST